MMTSLVVVLVMRTEIEATGPFYSELVLATDRGTVHLIGVVIVFRFE